MRVLMAKSWYWQVLEHDGELYLECNPEKFSVLFQLNRAERARFRKRGRVFVTEDLMKRIVRAPIRYIRRDITGPLAEQAGEAIMAYLRDTGEYPAGGGAPL